MTFSPAPLAPERLERSLEDFLAADGLSAAAPSQEVHDGYRRNRRNDILWDCFGWVFDGFAPVHTAWLSWIDAGGFIRTHIDAGPHRDRWQVPIRPSGTMTVDGEKMWAEAGVPFQVRHWLPHSVMVGTTPRVHLVIDREPFVTDDHVGFQLVEEGV